MWQILLQDYLHCPLRMYTVNYKNRPDTYHCSHFRHSASNMRIDVDDRFSPKDAIYLAQRLADATKG